MEISPMILYKTGARDTEMKTKFKCKNNEKGNVLFLILIAVALFAALSYAVTSSSRSGGGDANDETNLISSATITQYPASVRTAMIRMQVSKGIDETDMEFNVPSDFSNCVSSGVNCVFHPAGGGATFVEAPADVVTGTTPQAWVFNAENEINLVGTTGGSDTPTTATADIIAFLPNVRQNICERINSELGISSVPTESGINVTTNHENADGSTSGLPAFVASGTTGTIGEGGASSLDGQAFGCFQISSVYYYYHVLLEQ